MKKITIELTENQWDIVRTLIEKEREMRKIIRDGDSSLRTIRDSELDLITRLINDALMLGNNRD